jgi:ABC-type transport system involved in multi-copper enzyme maturation permease subunit
LSLLTAAALLFGVFTSSLLAVFLTFAVYLVGHLSQDMIKFAGITRNPGFQQFAEKLYLVVPDLSRLDLKNNAVYGILPPNESLLTNAAYGLVYTILLLTIAILIFSRREF